MDDILNYEKLVMSVAGKFKNYSDIDDLRQVGMMALMKALNNYKEGFNTKFSSYAYTYILGDILKYINENKIVKVSKDVSNLSIKINKAKDMMTQRLGRLPTNLEIALFLEISEEDVNNAINANYQVMSLDFIYSDNEDRDQELYDFVGYNDRYIDPEIMDLYDEIEKLPDNDKKIIYYRYFDGLTQSEVSEILNTNQGSISRNENKILKKLNNKLAA